MYINDEILENIDMDEINKKLNHKGGKVKLVEI